jgi:hypothetical protein
VPSYRPASIGRRRHATVTILWARLYARLRFWARLLAPVATLLAIGLVESAGRRWT